MKPQISKLAIADLRQIHSQTVARWGETQGQRYIASIWVAIDEVTQKPERCRLRHDIYPDCRLRFIGRHAIVYRIKSGRVQISRVLHERMAYEEHIPANFLQ